ncbi:hypothetical protein [Adhaeribacter radiodurans]|uniref:Uncharacterized protein n=1 Tax=Adhaeribacter radiodurans TaxID=2745197 RepID=A0A7L7L2Q0_9BACT|nr:hypothetical protein [Adhaeribacter radiodurans]QMU27071.1 hypothetical protein HUW48_03065 [Adhaeribacter radiodurans]
MKAQQAPEKVLDKQARLAEIEHLELMGKKAAFIYGRCWFTAGPTQERKSEYRRKIQKE